MNEILNTFLLVGDKFIPEMHLKQPGFIYSACGPFTRNKETIEKFMQNGNTDFIYKTALDKTCFQHDMAYGKSKDLTKRTQSDKIKHLKLRVIQNMMVIKEDQFTSFLIKSLVEVVLLINQITNLRVNFISRLLENLNDEKFIHRLETIFGVLI